MFKALIEIFQGKWPPIRMALRRFGTFKVTLVVTIISIIFSVLISIGIMFLTDGSISIMGLFISIIVPAILVPSFEYRVLSVLSQLDFAEEKLKIISTIDELTGAYNRRYFFEAASQELARAQRYNGIFSIAILDIDNFKYINDNYGHLAGDHTLVEIRKICNENIRMPDIFARYGGDEFIFLFPETGKEKARECLERIIKSISAKTISYENISIQIRISIGLAEYSHRVLLVDHMLKEADLALYRVKHEGGNKVI